MLSTSYPLRADSASGVFVQRLVHALPEPTTVEVLCPADADALTPAPQGRHRLHAFRYAPRVWRRLAQNPGGVLPAIRRSPVLIALMPALLLAMGWNVFRRARNAQLVHANWALCGAIAALALMIRRRPLVVTLRGDDVTLARRSVLHRMVLSMVIRRAARVVCVADSMWEQVAREYPAVQGRLRVVNNGVGDEFLTLPAPARSVSAAVRLLVIGSLIKRKGIDLLLLALAQSGISGVEVVIVGDGPERESLALLSSQLGLHAVIEFAGAQPPHRVPEYLAACDLLVFPSRSEGRPNVVLEAMAAGRPVVAFAIPGVTDLINSGTEGWLAVPENVTELARALAQAVCNPKERMLRGEAARRRVLASRWTWPAAGMAYAAIYDEAMADVTAYAG